MLELLAADAGIALLHFAQQAFFGGEQGALAVDVDGAAFEDDAALLAGDVDGRLPLRQAEELSGAGGNLVVEMPVGILGPGVEAPVGDG